MPNKICVNTNNGELFNSSGKNKFLGAHPKIYCAPFKKLHKAWFEQVEFVLGAQAQTLHILLCLAIHFRLIDCYYHYLHSLLLFRFVFRCCRTLLCTTTPLFLPKSLAPTNTQVSISVLYVTRALKDHNRFFFN